LPLAFDLRKLDMTYKTLLTCQELDSITNSTDLLIVDCRFNLVNTSLGESEYDSGHIPDAIYAHLDNDLSGAIIPGKTGRHPLPEVDELNRLFSSWGINESTQVVAYDDAGGPFAARLWWMLRWIGHDKVAVLDGGWKQWVTEARDVSQSEKTLIQSNFVSKINPTMLANADDVIVALDNRIVSLLDARTYDRFCGENEMLDAKAGHIPGAISAPFIDNLYDHGEFKDKRELAALYKEKTANNKGEDIVVYCGSGVTAAHDILAMEYCGISGAKLYAGSWSHWITDDSRPISTG